MNPIVANTFTCPKIEHRNTLTQSVFLIINDDTGKAEKIERIDVKLEVSKE